jgi:D-ribose pyranose/furanose isomerase RbsD
MEKSGLLDPVLLAAISELGHTHEFAPYSNVIVISGVPF